MFTSRLRLLLAFVVLLFVSQGLAQTPIIVGNQVATFTSMIRGYHFTAPTNFTICGLQVPTDASQGLQTIRVVRFTVGAPPAFPGNTNAFVQLFTITNAPNGIIPCNIPVTTGQIIGVYGVRGACVNSYGPPNLVTSINGFNTTLQRSGMQSCPAPGGAPMTNIWSEVNYNIGRIIMYINCCQPPTAVASNSGPICAGTSLGLSVNPTPQVAQNGVYTYAWSGPNGFTSALQNPTISNPTVATSGTYTCIINSPCGQVVVNTVVVVNPLPVANIMNTTGTNIIDCNTPVINVTATGGTTYAWNGGLGNTNTASITGAGLYTVTVTNAEGCTDTTSISVSVAPVPVINFPGDTICEGQSTTLNALLSPQGGVITWASGQNTASIVVNPLQTTTYIATYTLNGCSSVDSAVVVVNLQPQVSINSDTICNGENLLLTATPTTPGGSYQWSIGQTTQSIVVSPGIGTSSYSVIYNLLGCIASASGVVVVNPVPILVVAPVSICFGEVALLTAVPNLPGGSFLWSSGQTTASISTLDSISTTYDVTYTLQNCQSPTSTVSLTIRPLPLTQFTADTTYGCIPLNVTFTPLNSNPLTTYQWSSSNGFNGIGSQPQILYTTGGCYDVSVIATLNGCIDSLILIDYICVQNYPSASFNSSTLLFTETTQSVDFENTSLGAASYLWDFGNGQFSTQVSPTHVFMGTGSGFEITLIASTTMGCIDSTSIAISPQRGGIYYIPNSFTPDGDGYNQVFKPQFTSGFDFWSYNMTIYNRWGEVIFESNNLEVGWDGTYGLSGVNATTGTYTYKINIKVPDNDLKMVISGHINLIR